MKTGPDPDTLLPMVPGYTGNVLLRPLAVGRTNIGAGAVIAAKSVVARDVPPYAVAGGNPARTLRKRFDPRTVARLLAVAWWDWPVDRITAALLAIRGPDLDALETA